MTETLQTSVAVGRTWQPDMTHGELRLISDEPPISADWRDVCTIVITAAGMARPQRCVNGQAKAAAVCCGHYPPAPSAGQRCINPRSDSNPRKLISPRERRDGLPLASASNKHYTPLQSGRGAKRGKHIDVSYEPGTAETAR
jgi:hypothetical protein